MGWWLQEANIAQVSMNLGDLESTPMHIAFEEVVRDAKVSSYSRLCAYQSSTILLQLAHIL